MAATIVDVAARAGVSVATVSRALRGLPNVAAATRDRVHEAARALDYVADPNAARLAGRRSGAIGVVVPGLGRWSVGQHLAGIQAALAPDRHDLLLYQVDDAEHRRDFFRELPFRKRVDGLILVDLPLAAGDADALVAATGGLPVVTAGRAAERWSSVSVDHADAIAKATRHLANLGHRSIGLLADLTGPADTSAQAAPGHQCRDGYRHVLTEYGLPLHAELEARGHATMAGGTEAFAQLLGAGRPPTAVVAQNDEMAVGALRTARDAGLEVPGDLSIVGCDDHELAEFVGLTTVARPVAEEGETAAHMVLEAIRGGTNALERVVLSTKLTVRSTTAPRHDPHGRRTTSS